MLLCQRLPPHVLLVDGKLLYHKLLGPLVLSGLVVEISLNHGLCAYDSTLLVPVFYGVYSATGYAALF